MAQSVDYARYRFTDRQVREDSVLSQLAYEFVLNYGGDFDFLVNAQGYAVVHGELTVALARGVLNCMRSDTTGLKFLQGLESVVVQRQSRLRTIERQRPAYIDLPSTWHYDYIMSTHKLASTVHILDRQRSTVRWYPHVREFRLVLFACKPLYQSGLVMIHDIPVNRSLCKQCIKRSCT